MTLLTNSTTQYKKGFIFFALLTLFLIIPFFSSKAWSQDARLVARKAYPSIVLILTADSKGKLESQGSGFVVSEEIVVTCHHVIEGASSIYVRPIEEDKLYLVTRVVVSDPDKDLALLRVQRLNAPPLLLGNYSDIETGQAIFAVGNPEGLTGTISPGIISAIRKVGGQDYLQISAPISHGSSGGPILNMSGEVVGVAVLMLKDGQNLNFAVPVSSLNELMFRSKVVAEISQAKSLLISGPRRTLSNKNEGDPPVVDQWIKVGTFDSSDLHFNPSTIASTIRGTIKVWTKNTPISKNDQSFKKTIVNHWKSLGIPTKGYDKYSYSLILFELDCKEGMLQPVMIADYDIYDRKLNNNSIDNVSWSNAIPNSYGGLLLKTVCSKSR